MPPNRDYIPALHFHWLTPWYDRFMAKLYPEERIKGDLIEQAAVQAGQRVLDLGCGTATLALMLVQTQPAAEVHGLDVDAHALTIAQRKAQDAAMRFVCGSATRLPYPDGCFDRVFASLMLHHLARENKRLALQEVFRILKPGGELHVVDFAPPNGRGAWLISLFTRWAEEISDNIRGLVPRFMEEAGFQMAETGCYSTVSGTLRSYRAVKPMDGE